MAGLGTLATTQIITKGLSCQQCAVGSPAVGSPVLPCKAGIITTAFSLYCTTVPPTPPTTPTTGAGGGGWYPRMTWNKFQPGEIQNFYQELPARLQYYVVPRDQEDQYFRRHKHITLRVKLGDYTIEKEYAVPDHQARVVIKALNLINSSKEHIQITIANLKRITTRALVTISNFRLRRPHK